MASNFTQAQLDALTAALGQGVREVSYNGRKVVYGSTAEMLALRDRMMRELQRQGDNIPRPLANRSVFFKQ